MRAVLSCVQEMLEKDPQPFKPEFEDYDDDELLLDGPSGSAGPSSPPVRPLIESDSGAMRQQSE